MALTDAQAMHNSTAIPVDPLLTAREAAPLLDISVATFWRRVADGTIPKPIKLDSVAQIGC